jgi:eukaryotic-like serine/threonine-protein kinase
MTIARGTRFGPYEIVSPIGAGGMGEVYRATDTNLGRKVAIKVLPDAFAQDPERLARFEREAKTLASLNHANIAIIHGLEKSQGAYALVMELVEGEDLSQRIARGPIPLDEALPIAKQIAEALEAAHEQGIVHRDLKPANIKMRPDGTVKVLDFGLAKLNDPSVSNGPSGPNALSMSPTITSPAMMTGVGVILGTAAYMAPEQARGKPADKRGDIWAFGCVLYEMVTGKRAFDGEDVSQTMARVIEREPDFTPVPAQLRRLLKACLEKDRKKRLQAIGDVHLLLESAAPPPIVAPRPRLAMAGWIVGAAATVFAVSLAAIHFRETTPASPVVRSTLLPPDNTTFYSDFTQGIGLPALSPDGSRIVFGTRNADGTSPLWVRSLEALTAQPLPGTEGARFPFWSPDSRFIAFFADGKLKKIDASGGPVLTLTDAANGRGGSWNRDGVIIFAPNTTASGPLQRVSAAGGAATRIAGVDGSFPSFLPDGKHFLYQGALPGRAPGIRIGSLDGSPSVAVGAGSNALFANGYVLFVRETTLMALPFDPVHLTSTGEAVPVAEHIQSVLASGRAAAFSVSETGLVAYREGRATGGYTLTWVDRAGNKGATVGGSHFVGGDIQFSPDRTRVAMSILEATNTDVWIYDVVRGLRTRFTFDPANDNAPIWSPDGRSVVFRSNRKGHYDLYRKAVDGVAAEELLYADDLDKTPTGWSPDGTLLLYNGGRDQGQDLWALPLPSERGSVPKPSILLRTPFNEGWGQFSPDGRWILYVSDESQRNELYVSPFTKPRGLGGKRQISVAGLIGFGGAGGAPRWRQDGREIFYVSPDRQLVATEISIANDTLDVGMTHPLFDMLTELRQSFEVSADAQRFLSLGTTEEKTPTSITLIQHWPTGIRK